MLLKKYKIRNKLITFRFKREKLNKRSYCDSCMYAEGYCCKLFPNYGNVTAFCRKELNAYVANGERYAYLPYNIYVTQKV